MDVALEGAGAGVALHAADRSARAAPRPFGPLPRAAVAVYGFVLAGAGLTLCCQARHLNGFGAAGANALLLGLACVALAARAGRRPREAPVAPEPEPEDNQLVAARIVTALADLERQLDELSVQCATFDAQWADEDPHPQTPVAPQ
jgi:hypothetical protein